MDQGRNIADETTPGLGWARRVLRQQLDALSRLTTIAWRLLEPPTLPAESSDPATFFAALRGFEKAVRRQVRVDWALRLIGALRDKLRAELQAIDNGEEPNASPEAPNLAAESGPAGIQDPKERSERPERERLRDYERFSFQGCGADNKLAAILKRPTDEIIALICRELGLPADWPRLAEEAWAQEQRSRDDGGGGRASPSSGVYPRVDLQSSPGDKLRMRTQSSTDFIFEARGDPSTPTYPHPEPVE